ncbi:MAG: rhomboid family intramembrane serine protease [Ignavibacteria bacterium]|nr:rhomboid family intramembrane serine protease [Ignavibacteria bacterium]
MNTYYKPTGFGGFSFFPPVIKNLLIINVAVFFVQILGGQIAVGNGLSVENIIIKYFALIPIDGLGNEFIRWSFYPWQLITYQFLHGGFGHIFFNMFALWMFGMEIENSWGSKKFLYYYLLSGVGAGLFHLFLSPLLGSGNAPTIGASGAVYGIMIAFALMFPNRYIFLYFFIPVKAKYLITFLIVMEFMFINSANSSVAHLAHLGGALTGFIFILLDKRINVELKNVFSRSSNRTTKPFNPLGGITDRFKKKQENVEDAKYYEVEEKDEVTQEEIDRILDKISQSGYQNLTEKEKKILFQASKKMN